jgi:hypothetical protein
MRFWGDFRETLCGRLEARTYLSAVDPQLLTGTTIAPTWMTSIAVAAAWIDTR